MRKHTAFQIPGEHSLARSCLRGYCHSGRAYYINFCPATSSVCENLRVQAIFLFVCFCFYKALSSCDLKDSSHVPETLTLIPSTGLTQTCTPEGARGKCLFHSISVWEKRFGPFRNVRYILLCWVVESLWLFVLTLLLWFFWADESAVNMYVLHSGNSLIWIQVIAEAHRK